MSIGHLAVIRRLEALANEWPDDLWVFAAGGCLRVMRTGAKGERVMLPSGGFDPDYEIGSANIPSDGGDW